MFRFGKSFCAALLALSFAIAGFAADDGGITWTDSTRDVYVDGRLDRQAQVFRADDATALLADALPEVLVWEADTLHTLAKVRLEVSAERTKATSPKPETATDGEVVDAGDGHVLLRWQGHTVLVAPHRGLAGEVTPDEIWSTVPVWQARKDAYQPDAEAVAALRAADRDLDVTIAFGTWCGDSKRYVPELLKSLELAANPHLHVNLVAIERGFEKPLDWAQEHRLTNVPTILVSAGGEEIGRMVETPSSSDFMEADLAAIVSGRSFVPVARWPRERDVAHGVYDYVDDAGRVVGTETWEIFETANEATFVHTVIERDGKRTEVFHRRDRDGVSNLAEVTRSSAGEQTRTRLWIDDGRIQSMTRGNVTGIVEQTSELPEHWDLLLPGAVGAVPGDRDAEVFRLFGAGEPASGRLAELEITSSGHEDVEVLGGTRPAERVERRVDGETSTWWLDRELGIPLAGQSEDGIRVVLREVNASSTETIPRDSESP